MAESRDTRLFSMEIDSENADEALKQLLNMVALSDSLERARIELEFSEAVPLRTGLEGESEPEKPETDGPVDEPKPITEDQQEDSIEEDESVEPLIEGVKASKVPTIRSDTESYYVLKALSKVDQPLHTPQVREILNQEYSTDKEYSISKTLWSLGDRGMVDKQPSDRDARMKRYSITSKGRAALTKAEDSEN